MKEEAITLTLLVNKTKEELNDSQRRVNLAMENLRNYQSKCQHRFKESYDPIIHPAGYSQGDAPGTMGVDWQGPCSWPETREDRWKRECFECGLTQYTQNVEKEVMKKPKW